MNENRSYRIGRVVEETGYHEATIRRLEKAGKIPMARRTKGGYRVYTAAEIRLIKEIVLSPETKAS